MIKLSRWVSALLLIAVVMSATRANATIRFLPLDESEYVENLGSNQSDIFGLDVTTDPSYLDKSAFSGAGDTLAVTSCLSGTDCSTSSTVTAVTSGGEIIPYDVGIWIVSLTLTGTDPIIGTQFLSTRPANPLPNPSATPLPPLPLFATGLGGLGLLGWRRKRKVRAVV
jgi:hypothetical protein